MPRINSSFTSRVRNPGGAILLDYLARRFNYHTRAEWTSLLGKGRLELEGRPGLPEDIPREGQHLLFHVVDYMEPDVPLDFSILNAGKDGRPDGDLAFVHKPAGMPVHRTGRIFFQTLANLLKEKLGDGEGVWAPLNRLDRETSGIVAFARGPAAFREYAPSSKGSRWLKLYAAITRGEPPALAGVIDDSLGELLDSPIRCQMHPLVDGKPALTIYRQVAAMDGRALLVLAPVTGRKHQLRAHLARLGCPILGDKIYSLGGRAYLKQLDRDLDQADFLELGAERHQLHAFCLRIGIEAKTFREAWDWDMGTAFAGHFGGFDLQSWCATTAFSEMLEETESARRAFSAARGEG